MPFRLVHRMWWVVRSLPIPERDAAANGQHPQNAYCDCVWYRGSRRKRTLRAQASKNVRHPREDEPVSNSRLPAQDGC